MADPRKSSAQRHLHHSSCIRRYYPIESKLSCQLGPGWLPEQHELQVELADGLTPYWQSAALSFELLLGPNKPQQVRPPRKHPEGFRGCRVQPKHAPDKWSEASGNTLQGVAGCPASVY